MLTSWADGNGLVEREESEISITLWLAVVFLTSADAGIVDLVGAEASAAADSGEDVGVLFSGAGAEDGVISSADDAVKVGCA